MSLITILNKWLNLEYQVAITVFLVKMFFFNVTMGDGKKYLFYYILYCYYIKFTFLYCFNLSSIEEFPDNFLLCVCVYYYLSEYVPMM